MDDDSNMEFEDEEQDEMENEDYEIESSSGMERWGFIEEKLGHPVNEIATVQDMKRIDNLNYDDGEENYYGGAFSWDDSQRFLQMVSKKMGLAFDQPVPYKESPLAKETEKLTDDEDFFADYSYFKILQYAFQHMKIGTTDGIPKTALPRLITRMKNHHIHMLSSKIRTGVPLEEIQKFMLVQDIPLIFDDRYLHNILKVRVPVNQVVACDSKGYPLDFYEPSD